MCMPPGAWRILLASPGAWYILHTYPQVMVMSCKQSSMASCRMRYRGLCHPVALDTLGVSWGPEMKAEEDWCYVVNMEGNDYLAS